MERFVWLLRNNMAIAAEGCFWRLVLAFFLSFFLLPYLCPWVLFTDWMSNYPPLIPVSDLNRGTIFTMITEAIGIWILAAIGAWLYIFIALPLTWLLLRRGLGGLILFAVAGLVLGFTQSYILHWRAPEDIMFKTALQVSPFLGPAYAVITWVCLRFIHPRQFNPITSSPA